jgi:hypothetical protein
MAEQRGQDLLETSVSSKKVGSRVLVYSSCIPMEHPTILARPQFQGYTKLSACLTSQSFDKIAWKLLTLTRVRKLKELAALTMDGSPHCLQLHFALEDVRKACPSLKTKHYVIEKGALYEVSDKAVRAARHLKEIESCLE